MSARHVGAYSENNANKIRFFETCGHNKLCPYKVLRLLLLFECKIEFTSNETADDPLLRFICQAKASIPQAVNKR